MSTRAALPDERLEGSVFVARQPVLDAQLRTYAYELLYREGAENAFPGIDAEVATARVLTRTAAAFPLEIVTGGKPAFVNFTRDLLVSGAATLLPPERLVVEILEDVQADAEVVDACRRLRRRGYRLALDDVAGPDPGPLIDLVDFAKVDFQLVDRSRRGLVAERLRRPGLTLVAEKVETRADFEQAVALGYTYFQGYFLSRPVVVESREMPVSATASAQILAAVQSSPLDLDAVETAMKCDVALMDRLLRLINSGLLGWRHPITSLRDGLVLLGENQVRRWVSLLALAGLAGGRPPELLTMSLVRAHMCEALSGSLPPGLDGPSGLEYYLAGMYSLIDALLEQEMESALAQLPLSPAVRDALLLDVANPLRRVLDIVIAYETGDWNRTEDLAAALDLDDLTLSAAHCRALEATDHLTLD